MTNSIYEVLYRGNPDGSIAGRHIRRFNSDGSIGLPLPVTDADLASIESEINGALLNENNTLAAAITRAEAIKAAADKKLANQAKQVEALRVAVLDPKVDTDQAALEIIASLQKDDNQKKADEIDAQIAKLQAQKAELLP